ncbi:MAG: hypothetical protein QGF20_17970 [Alphaproteobacteria bacterium]|nr:hypothetical protein [Alphaproteobacteria bacterium]
MSRQADGEAADGHGAANGDGDTRQPLLVARGTGGRLVLWEDQVWLIKYNLFSGVINLFGFGIGKINKAIIIKQISSVTIVQPMLFPSYITFTYPGCPVSTGNMMQDALAENALLMNFYDNRPFFELKERMDSLRQAHQPGEGTG